MSDELKEVKERLKNVEEELSDIKRKIQRLEEQQPQVRFILTNTIKPNIFFFSRMTKQKR